MKCYGLFHGGSSYSTHVTNRDIESFSTIERAKDAFQTRIDWDPYYPCVVAEQATMMLFFEDPRTDGVEIDLIDPGYPDRTIMCGPKGGLIYSRC